MSELLQFAVDEGRGVLMRKHGAEGTLFGVRHARLGSCVIDCYEVRKHLIAEGVEGLHNVWLWGWSGECPAVVHVYGSVKGEQVLVYKLRVVIKCIDWGLVGMSDKSFAVFCTVHGIEECSDDE